MSTPVDILEQAAERWRRRSIERERRPAERAESSRPRMRAVRLTRAAAQEKARALALAADRTGRSAASTVSEFAFERILGKSDLLDANFLELAIAMARPVARIRLRSGFGTGFLVSPSLLMTNNHVLGQASDASSAEAEFDFQENRSGDLLPVQEFQLQPDRFFFTSQPLDFSLVAIAPKSARGVALDQYGWVKLIADEGKADNGDCVNIVQHPKGGLKQIALRENEIVDIFDDFLHYLTDTEPGSSGSPCFNDQWELVALHHSGVPKTDESGRLLSVDGGVWRRGVDSPERLAWIANEGIRVSSIIRTLQAAEMNAAQERLIEELLNADPPNPIELARTGPSTAPASSTIAVPAEMPVPPKANVVAAAAGSSGSQVTFTIPIQVTITVGGPGVPAAAAPAVIVSAPAPAPAPSEDLEEAIQIDRNYSNRSGYSPDFIDGFKVPLPQMTDAMIKNSAVNTQGSGAKRQVFDYEHFSLTMNKRRRLAWYTAVNIDGKAKQAIGSRSGDKWSFDTRLDQSLQIGEDAYASNVLDRGHLVRRLDPVWGPNKTVAKRGNDDTFHFTNCSPQHKTFNQGGELWQGLENYLLDKAQDERKRLTVFTGPILRNSDPVFQSDRMKTAIRIPLEFWKVAALVKPGGKKAVAAFLVSQADLIGDATDLMEKFQPRTFQVPLGDIERLTGLRFTGLREHDTIADGRGLERFETFDTPVRVLDSLEDIVL